MSANTSERHILSSEAAREIQQKSMNPTRLDEAIRIANELIQDAALKGDGGCNVYEARCFLTHVEELAFIKILERSGYRVVEWWANIRWDEEPK